jgi:gamma-glutamyltranspeptidase / glutathione hydrolase
VLQSSIRTTRVPVTAPNGVVAAGHELEVDAGVRILERGGNAVDAAVAAAFVAGVVEPWNCGLGGHGFCSIYRADGERTEVLNWVTRAPRLARPDLYELEPGYGGVFDWPRVKDDAQATGYLAAEVPATASGLATLLARHGTMTLPDVLGAAIELATEGFTVDWRTCYLISSALGEMRRFPALGAIYAPDGLPPRAGTFYRPADRLVLGDLGRTLQRLASEGPEFIERGDMAVQIVGEVQSHGGILTLEDLAESQPVVEDEPRSSYRDATYITGVCPVIVEVLNLLECFDIAALGPDHPTYRHLMLEAMRQAWVDCLTFLGDPATVVAPWEGLLSKAYARDMANTINPGRAMSERPPGDPWKYDTRSRPTDSMLLPSTTATGTVHTTQVVSIDRWGNMVSLEESLGNSFGSQVAIPGTGIVLGNGLVSFDPRPGRTQSMAPGRRPWKAAPAVLMFRGGQPWATICASGGRRTTSAALHTMVHLVDFGMDLQTAIETPRVHCELGAVFVDDRIPPATLSALASMGHRVVSVHEDVAAGAFGRPSAALIDPSTGARVAGGDALRSAGAAGH